MLEGCTWSSIVRNGDAKCCIFSLALQAINVLDGHSLRWEELYMGASSAVYLSSVSGVRQKLTCRWEAPNRDS